MNIEIINRSFVIRIDNDSGLQMGIRCSENHMQEMNRFIRMCDLGFKTLRSRNSFINASHRVASSDGVLEAPTGKIFWEIIDGSVILRPLNGSLDFPDHFTVPLEKLVQVLCQETNHGRWDDYCIGHHEYEGRVMYFYTHMLFDDLIVVTDRSSYYAELRVMELDNPLNQPVQWGLGDYYLTDEMWEVMANEEDHKRHGAIAKNYGSVLSRALNKYMTSNEFTKPADVFTFFGVTPIYQAGN